jgi:hypothetical protein
MDEQNDDIRRLSKFTYFHFSSTHTSVSSHGSNFAQDMFILRTLENEQK